MCLGDDDDDKQNDDNSIQSEEDEPAGPDSGVRQEQGDVYIEKMDRVEEIINENKMFKARKDKANGSIQERDENMTMARSMLHVNTL